MNKTFSRSIAVAAGFAYALLSAHAAHADLAPAEQAAVFKAAGFKMVRGGQYKRCVEESPMASSEPGRIELADLNGDGQPEAWVKESSTFCYGNTAEYFVLLTKGPSGWRVLLKAVGVPVELKQKRQGWPDIEVGGPGFGKFPVYRWDGRSYGLRK